jgi:hypothetical protein
VRDLRVTGVERRAHARHIQSIGCPTTEVPTSPRTLSTWRPLSACRCSSTPSRSPGTNGISETFVKTFKRDYAGLNILHDAIAILAMLLDSANAVLVNATKA